MNDWQLLPLCPLGSDGIDSPQLCEDRNGVMFARPIVHVHSCEKDVSEVCSCDGCGCGCEKACGEDGEKGDGR